MRKNSIKNTRINAEVQKELSRLLSSGEIKDPRISPWTSVTRVEVAPDLLTCKVYVSVLGDEEALEKTTEGLASAEGYIRKHLASTVNLRNTPQLIFLADDSIAYGVFMTHKIDEVIREDEKAESERIVEDEED